MAIRSEVHWNKLTRCQGKFVEKRGRTHHCKLQAGHIGTCSCICSRTWGEA